MATLATPVHSPRHPFRLRGRGELADSRVYTVTNNLYQSMLKANIARTVAAAKSATWIQHPGSKGRARELFLVDLLIPFLPPTVGVCSGIVVDTGNHSCPQADVLLFDRRVASPLLFSSQEGAVPIESLVAAMEVKSRLKRRDLVQAVQLAESIVKMRFHPSAKAKQKRSCIPNPFVGVFAYGSTGNESQTDLDRIKGVLRESGHRVTTPLVHGLCVVRKACHVLTRSSRRREPEWRSCAATDDGAEVVAFLTLVFNSFRPLMASRGPASIGPYIY